MEATLNKKAQFDKRVTIKMSTPEYYAIKRILKDIAGVGEGHISTETTNSKNAYVIKVLASMDSIAASVEFPEIKN